MQTIAEFHDTAMTAKSFESWMQTLLKEAKAARKKGKQFHQSLTFTGIYGVTLTLNISNFEVHRFLWQERCQMEFKVNEDKFYSFLWLKRPSVHLQYKGQTVSHESFWATKLGKVVHYSKYNSEFSGLDNFFGGTGFIHGYEVTQEACFAKFLKQLILNMRLQFPKQIQSSFWMQAWAKLAG